MVELTVPLAELKDRLDECLARVRRGDTVLLVEGDEVVAQVQPSPGGRSLAERLARLQDEGLIQWGGGRLQALDKPGRLTPGGKTMAEIVEELRD